MNSSYTLSTTSIAIPSSSAIPVAATDEPGSPHHASPVVAFIIGLAIILLASILNAAGLNLTKLDHVSDPMVRRLMLYPCMIAVRSEPVPSRKSSAGETGYDRYGYWGWSCICEFRVALMSYTVRDTRVVCLK